MKKETFIRNLPVILTTLVLMVFGVVAYGLPVVEEVLLDIWDSSNDNIRVAFDTGEIGGDVTLENGEVVSNATDGLVEVQTETALTNAVQGVFEVQHTTSGVPANGIGVGMDFQQETSAANNELIMSLDAVVDDATAGSEDASFSVKLMEAGAAAAEKFAIESTGVVTLNGGATLDNDTSATNLNITETTVTITGNAVVTGSTDITGAAGLILENDETITNSVDGTVLVTATTLATSGAIDVTGGGVTLENDETITNAVDGTMLLTAPIVEVSAAFKLEFETSDPCGTFGEGTLFYNDTANVLCFCDGTNDLKVADGTACF